jgi:hypothetical protein
MMSENEKYYKQVQFIAPNDTRTFEERHRNLPFVREEDHEEWKNWWENLMNIGPNNNVSYNR